jgi:hypothetical protein
MKEIKGIVKKIESLYDSLEAPERENLYYILDYMTIVLESDNKPIEEFSNFVRYFQAKHFLDEALEQGGNDELSKLG